MAQELYEQSTGKAEMKMILAEAQGRRGWHNAIIMNTYPKLRVSVPPREKNSIFIGGSK